MRRRHRNALACRATLPRRVRGGLGAAPALTFPLRRRSRRTRRSWKPNVQNKRFWSETYQRFLSFRMTTSVIKQVKRLAGGIDEYLRVTPNRELLYQKAIKIKRNLRRAERVQQRDEALARLAEAEGAALEPPAASGAMASAPA